MKHDGVSLRRSMDAAPEPWLDQQVTERVRAEVRAQCAARASERAPARGAQRAGCDRAGQSAPRGWFGKLLARLMPPRAQPLLWRGRDQQG